MIINDWIELHLDKNRPIMIRKRDIGDLYIDRDGHTNITPKYDAGNEFIVIESYDEVKKLLLEPPVLPFTEDKTNEATKSLFEEAIGPSSPLY